MSPATSTATRTRLFRKKSPFVADISGAENHQQPEQDERTTRLQQPRGLPSRRAFLNEGGLCGIDDLHDTMFAFIVAASSRATASAFSAVFEPSTGTTTG